MGGYPGARGRQRPPPPSEVEEEGVGGGLRQCQCQRQPLRFPLGVRRAGSRDSRTHTIMEMSQVRRFLPNMLLNKAGENGDFFILAAPVVAAAGLDAVKFVGTKYHFVGRIHSYGEQQHLRRQ